MFVTTLARQLADSQPVFKSHLSTAIANHESLKSQGLRTQWEQFVLDPLSKTTATSSGPLKLVFVIDAMDECDRDENIKLILQLFLELKNLQTKNTQIFLTSRPETIIRLGFSNMPPIVHRDLNLGSVPSHVVERDISTFLTHELRRIGEEHNLLNLFNTIDINALVRKCDLLFIYATTLCRFIDDKNDVLNNRLSKILQNTSTEGPKLSRLDDIYTKILEDRISRDRNRIELDEIIERFQRIIGSFILLSNVFSAPVFSNLLHIHINKVDVSFNPLHSLIYIPTNPQDPLRALYPSFRDFLLNKKRCLNSNFSINTDTTHIRLARNCLQSLSEFLYQDMCNLRAPGSFVDDIKPDRIHSSLLGHVQYACRYWVDHLSKISQHRKNEAGLHQHGEVQAFFQKHFLHWLEAMSLMRRTRECVIMITELQSLVDVS